VVYASSPPYGKKARIPETNEEKHCLPVQAFSAWYVFASRLLGIKPRHARMVDQSRQSGFRMAKELVGGINLCSTSSFVQWIIFPLQYDRAEKEMSTLRGGLTFGG